MILTYSMANENIKYIQTARMLKNLSVKKSKS